MFRCFLLTSAKAKKFQYGERSIRLYTTISLQLRRFLKIATIVYQKDSRSFQQWVQQEAKRSYFQDYEGTHTHTHRQIAITLFAANNAVLILLKGIYAVIFY